ncbi:MAG TPA: thiamine phosphate synthase [Caulobacteraceae bacterium]|jgi:thiamine-phosphate pyrophosphorylase
MRTPDPVAIAETLPRGVAVVYRAFGAEDAGRTAATLREATLRHGALLLVGDDEALAADADADGLHLPERAVVRAPEIRARHPDWLLTGAAHDAAALARAAEAGLDAAVLSPVFSSRSPSAGPPLGAVRFAAMVREAQLPVIALGGIDGGTAQRLIGSGAAGFAAVEGWLSP